MKFLLLFTCLVLLLAGCQKVELSSRSPYVDQVQKNLRDSVPGALYEALDWARARRTPADSNEMNLLRVPLRGKALKEEFLLLQTSREGRLQKGRWVTVRKDPDEARPLEFNGTLIIRSLKGEELLTATVVRGYATAGHRPPTVQGAASLMPSGEMLPEVVVVASYSSSGISYSDWVNLNSFLGESGGSSSGWYYSLDGSGGLPGGGGSGGGLVYDYGGGVVTDEPILIDYEVQDVLPAVDIVKYINCFNAIPDAGATCSIEIFADVPVDSHPEMFFDFNNGSPGHTFIQIKKSNGTQSIVQNIGFYPKSGLKAVFTNAPIEGKFVDNSLHEYNASLKMDLSTADFRSTLTEILYLANIVKYDIDNYNCTDFTLDVFNKTRTNKLEVELYDLPGNIPSTGTRTPQGLYKKLKQMKDSNHPEAANITIGILKGWVANSTGPCN